MHRPDMPSNRGAILRRLKKRKRSCVPEKKLYFHTLYLNTLLNTLYSFQYFSASFIPICLKISQSQQNFHVISKKANCKYVAAKRKFQNNYQNSRTYKITTRCNLRGELSESCACTRTLSQLHVHACRPELASTET